MNWKFDFSPETSAVVDQKNPFSALWSSKLELWEQIQDLHMMGR